MSNTNTQSCSCLPCWPPCLIQLPSASLVQDVTHCSFVNMLRSFVLSHMLVPFPETSLPTQKHPFPPPYYLCLIQCSLWGLLSSRNFSFSQLLKDACCHHFLLEDEDGTLRGYHESLPLGHTWQSEPGWVHPQSFPDFISFNCTVNSHHCRHPLLDIACFPGLSVVILYGSHRGEGLSLTWCVEQAWPSAMVGHLLLTVLWAVNHGFQLLHAATIIQGHGVGLLRVCTPHMRQLCVIVLHWCPNLVLCPENIRKETLEGKVKRGPCLYNPIKLGEGGSGRGSHKQCDAWLNMGQSIRLNAPLTQIKTTENFCFS